MSAASGFAGLLPATQAEVRALTRNDVAVTPFGLAGRACFLAKLAASQFGVASATFTKVNVTNEITDVGGYYDGPNARWIPPAGPIELAAAVDLLGTVGLTVGTIAYCTIYKNGGQLQSNIQAITVNQINPLTVATDLANGTDVYELYCWAQCGGGTITVNVGSGGCYFKGSQI